MTIETKFSVGDVAWFASTTTEKRQRPCPDCKGGRKWKAVSPAGTEYEFACPRCTARFQSKDAMSLDYSVLAPRVECITIRQIRAEYPSPPHSADRCPIHYMSSGSGSGLLYPEDHLFATKEEAEQFAAALAADKGNQPTWMAPLYDKALALSDYQLENAVKAAGELAERERRGKLACFLGDLRDAEDMADVKRAYEAFTGEALTA